jgi:predicted dehydrogenase
MEQVIRWGILGTGAIAKTFAKGLTVLPDAELVAVGSRSQESADAFGDAFDVPRRHATYEGLAADPDVDAIYVSTPHHLHKDNSILCLRAGKAVLCEKPLTINAAETEELIAVSRETGSFLMEAMWTRFLPITVQVKEWLAAGVIGAPRMLIGDFGFRTDVNPEGRLFDPACGGGGLMDVGVYLVSMASMIFGQEPQRIEGLADIGTTGVDEQAAWVLGYEGGELASLTSAIRTNTPHQILILGTDGQITIHSQFWKGTSATLSVAGKDDARVEAPFEGNGYQLEAAEVMRCMRAGEKESPLMTLDESLAIMRTLDRIRAKWGLSYPMESL